MKIANVTALVCGVLLIVWISLGMPVEFSPLWLQALIVICAGSFTFSIFYRTNHQVAYSTLFEKNDIGWLPFVLKCMPIMLGLFFCGCMLTFWLLFATKYVSNSFEVFLRIGSGLVITLLAMFTLVTMLIVNFAKGRDSVKRIT